jgi:hypothetical protein
MELLAARTGSVLHYNQPYTPIQKAKIERWFRTMKDQWLASLDTRDFTALLELRDHLRLMYCAIIRSRINRLKACHLRITSFRNPNTFANFPMRKSKSIFFWRSNGGFP